MTKRTRIPRGREKNHGWNKVKSNPRPPEDWLRAALDYFWPPQAQVKWTLLGPQCCNIASAPMKPGWCSPCSYPVLEAQGFTHGPHSSAGPYAPWEKGKPRPGSMVPWVTQSLSSRLWPRRKNLKCDWVQGHSEVKVGVLAKQKPDPSLPGGCSVHVFPFQNEEPG